jgi:hypothetical protein
MAMGTHYPMRPIFTWLFTHIPGLFIFRSVWYKFSLPLMFSYAILIGLAIDALAERFKSRRAWIVAAALLLFIVNAYPLFLGLRLWTKAARQTLPPNRIDLPSYTLDFDKWIDEQPPGRVLGAEQMLFDSTNYSWGYGDIHPFLVDMMSNRGFVYNLYNYQVSALPYILLWNSNYFDRSFPLQNILNVLNVRYVLSQGDTDFKYFGPSFTYDDALKRLEELSIKPDKQFGPWKVYINDQAWPDTFITDRVTHLVNFNKEFATIPSTPTAFVVDDQTDAPGLDNLKSNAQPAQTVELKPTIVKKVTQIFTVPASNVDRLIVFNQSFNSRWQATLNGKKLIHDRVNIYANGFTVPAGESGQVTIEFTPQRTLDALTLVSALGLLIAGLALVWQYMVHSKKVFTK